MGGRCQADSKVPRQPAPRMKGNARPAEGPVGSSRRLRANHMGPFLCDLNGLRKESGLDPIVQAKG